jgi:hypothetical protein
MGFGRWVGALAKAEDLTLEGSGRGGVGPDGAEIGKMRMGDAGRCAMSNRARSASWSSMKSAPLWPLFHARTNWKRNKGLGNPATCSGVPFERRDKSCI